MPDLCSLARTSISQPFPALFRCAPYHPHHSVPYGRKGAIGQRIARALDAATCQVLKGSIIHLDDVGGAIAFQKICDKKGNLVDTLAFSGEGEVALDYKLIQDTFGTNLFIGINGNPRRSSLFKYLSRIGNIAVGYWINF